MGIFIHELKIWPVHFDPLIRGVKKAEYRWNDREFKVGDVLKFREWDPETEEYTGRHAFARVIHVADQPPIPAGFALLSLTRP